MKRNNIEKKKGYYDDIYFLFGVMGFGMLMLVVLYFISTALS